MFRVCEATGPQAAAKQSQSQSRSKKLSPVPSSCCAATQASTWSLRLESTWLSDGWVLLRPHGCYGARTCQCTGSGALLGGRERRAVLAGIISSQAWEGPGALFKGANQLPKLSWLLMGLPPNQSILSLVRLNGLCGHHPDSYYTCLIEAPFSAPPQSRLWKADCSCRGRDGCSSP